MKRFRKFSQKFLRKYWYLKSFQTGTIRVSYKNNYFAFCKMFHERKIAWNESKKIWVRLNLKFSRDIFSNENPFLMQYLRSWIGYFVYETGRISFNVKNMNFFSKRPTRNILKQPNAGKISFGRSNVRIKFFTMQMQILNSNIKEREQSFK